MTDNPPTTLVARSPEDLLAMVPIVLGFTPSDSVVMLTFGARHPFHARIDLPVRPAETEEMVEALTEPAVRNGVQGAVLVVYADDGPPARRAWRRLRRGLEQAGIDVLEGLRVHDGRWYPLLGCDPRTRATGVPFDLSGHRFAAQAVVDGRVTHASRAALAALLDPDPDALVEVGLLLGEGAVDDDRWVDALVRRQVAGADRLTPAEVARLLRALGRPGAVEAAWSSLTRRDAQRHVDLWLDVLRRTPTPSVPTVAGLLALAAWQAGQGALAWCAVDRCTEVEPDHPLAVHVTDMLIGAVSPDEWEPRAS